MEVHRRLSFCLRRSLALRNVERRVSFSLMFIRSDRVFPYFHFVACAHQSLELVSSLVISVVRRYNARNSGRGICDRAWSLVVSKLIRNEEICDRKLLLFQMSVGTWRILVLPSHRQGEN